MAKIDLTSREWCELVFEGKNKEYGAYEMRQTSSGRHQKSVVIVVIAVLIAFSLPALIKIVTPKQDKEVMEEVTTLADLQTPEEEKTEELKKPDLPPPPPLKSSIKFTPPVIKKDEEVREEDEIKSQDDLNLNKTAISIADIKGTDDLHGKDIADIKEVVKEPVKQEVKHQVYQTVEQMPQFPGGQKELMKYLQANIKYPQAALENNIQGRVIVQFVVGPSGAVSDVQVLAGLDRLCDREAVRVVEAMPNWIAGKHNGVAVPVYYRVPVTFKIMQ